MNFYCRISGWPAEGERGNGRGQSLANKQATAGIRDGHLARLIECQTEERGQVDTQNYLMRNDEDALTDVSCEQFFQW